MTNLRVHLLDVVGREDAGLRVERTGPPVPVLLGDEDHVALVKDQVSGLARGVRVQRHVVLTASLWLGQKKQGENTCPYLTFFLIKNMLYMGYITLMTKK